MAEAIDFSAIDYSDPNWMNNLPIAFNPGSYGGVSIPLTEKNLQEMEWAQTGQETLKQKILAQGTMDKWSTGSGLSKETAAGMMAQKLFQAGITRLEDFGKIPVKETVPVVTGHYETQDIPDEWGGYSGQTKNVFVEGSGQSGYWKPTEYSAIDADGVTNTYTKDVFTPLTQAEQAQVKDGKFTYDTGQTTYGNKVTGQAIPVEYDRAKPGDWGGTFAGDSSSGFGVGFNDLGMPMFYTHYDVDNGPWGAILSIASLIPGPQQPFLMAANAALSYSQGNTTGALLSALGSAAGFAGSGLEAVNGMDLQSDIATLGYNPASVVGGIQTAQQAVGLMKSVSDRNFAGIISSLTNLAPQIGVTIPEDMIKPVQMAAVGSALSRGDWAAAAGAAGTLTNNSDLTLAGKGINLVKAIQSGRPESILSAGIGFAQQAQLNASVIKDAAKQAGLPLSDANANKLMQSTVPSETDKMLNTWLSEAKQIRAEYKTQFGQDISDDLLQQMNTDKGFVSGYNDFVKTPEAQTAIAEVATAKREAVQLQNIKDFYKNVLGRDATQDELTNFLGEFGGVDKAISEATKRTTVAVGNAEADNPQEAAALAKIRDPYASQFTYGGQTYQFSASDAELKKAFLEGGLDPSNQNFYDKRVLVAEKLLEKQGMTIEGSTDAQLKAVMRSVNGIPSEILKGASLQDLVSGKYTDKPQGMGADGIFRVEVTGVGKVEIPTVLANKSDSEQFALTDPEGWLALAKGYEGTGLTNKDITKYVTQTADNLMLAAYAGGNKDFGDKVKQTLSITTQGVGEQVVSLATFFTDRLGMDHNSAVAAAGKALQDWGAANQSKSTKDQEETIKDAVSKADGVGGKIKAFAVAAYNNPGGFVTMIAKEGVQEILPLWAAKAAYRFGSLAAHGANTAIEMMEAWGGGVSDTYGAAIKQGFNEDQARAMASKVGLQNAVITAFTSGIGDADLVNRVIKGAAQDSLVGITKAGLKEGVTEYFDELLQNASQQHQLTGKVNWDQATTAATIGMGVGAGTTSGLMTMGAINSGVTVAKDINGNSVSYADFMSGAKQIDMSTLNLNVSLGSADNGKPITLNSIIEMPVTLGVSDNFVTSGLPQVVIENQQNTTTEEAKSFFKEIFGVDPTPAQLTSFVGKSEAAAKDLAAEQFRTSKESETSFRLEAARQRDLAEAARLAKDGAGQAAAEAAALKATQEADKIKAWTTANPAWGNATKTQDQLNTEKILAMISDPSTSDLRYDLNKDGKITSADAALVSTGTPARTDITATGQKTPETLNTEAIAAGFPDHATYTQYGGDVNAYITAKTNAANTQRATDAGFPDYATYTQYRGDVAAYNASVTAENNNRTATQAGFPDYATYTQYGGDIAAYNTAKTDASNLQRAKDAGFPDYQNYTLYGGDVNAFNAANANKANLQKATAAGFPDYATYTQFNGKIDDYNASQTNASNTRKATDAGFPDYTTYTQYSGNKANYDADLAAKTAGWTNAEQQATAQSAGYTDATAYKNHLADVENTAKATTAGFPDYGTYTQYAGDLAAYNAAKQSAATTTAINNAIAGIRFPAGVSSTDVANQIKAAMEAHPGLNAADVTNAISSYMTAHPGITAADVSSVVNTATQNLVTNAALTTALAAVDTATQAKFNTLTETQRNAIASQVQMGIDLTTAINNSNTALTTKLNTLSTDTQSKFEALTTEQKNLALQMESQGVDLTRAINNAATNTATQIANVKTDLTTNITNVQTQFNTRVDELMRQGQTYQAATDTALKELGTGVTGLQTSVTDLQKQEADRVAAEKAAAEKARQQSSLSKAMSIFAPAAGAAALADTSTPGYKDIGLKTSGDAKFESVLSPFEQMVQSDSYAGKQQQQTEQPTQQQLQQAAPVNQDLNPPQDQQQGSNYFNYGNSQEIDQLLGGNAAMPLYKAGGLATPLFAGGGTTRHGRYAGGGLNVVEHSGKARLDFRTGNAVTGPGDGQSDDIPAMLADGEFVFPADVVAALGNGSTKAGSDKLYDMMHSIRAYHRSAKPEDLPPAAKKSPLDYLKKTKARK